MSKTFFETMDILNERFWHFHEFSFFVFFFFPTDHRTSFSRDYLRLIKKDRRTSARWQNFVPSLHWGATILLKLIRYTHSCLEWCLSCRSCELWWFLLWVVQCRFLFFLLLLKTLQLYLRVLLRLSCVPEKNNPSKWTSDKTGLEN